MDHSHANVKHVHYVIVVHGIGEQRPNETVLAVINRFAEARKADFEGSGFPKPNGFVTMGKVAAQVGTKPLDNGHYRFTGTSPWAQFEGIPVKKGADVGNFNAVQSGGTDDIRFVDMWWADILNDYFDVSGQDIKTWTDGVVSRLKNSGTFDDRKTWVMKVLQQVQETALFAQTVSGLPGVKARGAFDNIMHKFVGDIQIYGENRSVRGRAVRRFHNLMEKIHNHHLEMHKIKNYDATIQDVNQRYKDAAGVSYIPKYNIIAHSLGTVMAMDAIMYAHIKTKVAYGHNKKADVSHYHNLPFEQYTGDHLRRNIRAENRQAQDADGNLQTEEITKGECIGSNWLESLETFTTLGSPIDKYLTLWPENYDYLKGVAYRTDVPPGAGEVFHERPKGKKIRHFNYCDEQDPVGHKLDMFADTDAYPLIFEHNPDHDVTYNAYKVPGVAHVKYWEDQELFQRILHQTIDHEDDHSGQAFANKRSTIRNFRMVIFYTYYLPALLAGIAMACIFYFGWDSMKDNPGTGWQMGLISAFAFSLTGYAFKKMIRLSIWWRQILRSKSKTTSTPGKKTEETTVRPKYHSRHTGKNFRISLILGNIFLLGSSMFFIPAAIANSTVNSWFFAYEYLGMLLGSGLMIYFLGKWAWQHTWAEADKTSKRPEIATVIASVIVAASTVAIGFLIPAETLRSWNLGIPEKLLIPFSILLACLSLAWLYTTSTFIAIKRELKGQ